MGSEVILDGRLEMNLVERGGVRNKDALIVVSAVHPLGAVGGVAPSPSPPRPSLPTNPRPTPTIMGAVPHPDAEGDIPF
jgi:hypothetical protein